MRTNSAQIIKKEKNFIKADEIALYSGLWLSAGIILSYIISVYLKQVKPFPFCNISQTADHYPSFIIFRITELSGAWFFFLVWMMVYWWMQEMQTQLLIPLKALSYFQNVGFLSSFLYTVSTATIDTGKMDDTLHVICATSSMILMYTLIVLCTINLHLLRQKQKNIIPEISFLIKQIITLLGLILIILKIISPGENSHVIGNVIEYVAAFMIIFYVMSFTLDWPNYVLEFELMRGLTFYRQEVDAQHSLLEIQNINQIPQQQQQQ